MPLANWLAFTAASIILLLIPGPTVLLVVSYSLTQGRRVALATAAGVALGDFTSMTLSLAGLGALLAASATMFTVLRWAGAAYLIYLGIRLWRAEPVLATVDAPARSARSILHHAYTVTALNPKSLVFFVALVPQFISHDVALLPQLVILEATFVTLATLNTLMYALAADTLRSRIRRSSVLRWMNRIGGASLIGLGAATAALARR